jgi:D-proline reductase (dithiol) PrdB
MPWLLERLGGRLGRAEAAPAMPPLVRPGPQARWRVGLLTAAGVHLARQPPFDMTDPDGDPTFRVLPPTPAADDLTITHDYYDHSAADRDVNCVLPLDRLRELAARGVVGDVAPRHVSFMGHLAGARLEAFVREQAPAIARLFVDDGVHVVVAAPG